MHNGTEFGIRTTDLLRTRCDTPMGLKYARTHRATGLTEVSAFSAHTVLTGFPGHVAPAAPSLGDLVALVDSWNGDQGEWHYSLCQGSHAQPAHASLR